MCPLMTAFAVAYAGSGNAVAKAKVNRVPREIAAASGPPRSDAPALMRAFTTERVLAKPTGQGEPPNLRLAAVESGSTTTDASSLLGPASSPTVQEPFGLSTFRAPPGLLW